MKQIITLFLLTVSLFVHGQAPIVMKVWPHGAPNSNGIKGHETDFTKESVTDVAEATLLIFPAKNPNGQAIISCPGGGYTNLAMQHEGISLASWFNSQGITYAVLAYRMPHGHHDVPLSDALESIRILRRHADEWKIKTIGIMGSSAGGHLASTAATHYTADSRPDFQILFYPVITISDFTHKDSWSIFFGENPSDELIRSYSSDLQVTEDTPPAFILHSSDDRVVPVINSISYYMALVKKGVSVTMHIYPMGGHGWGFGDGFIYKRQWTGELEKWLREMNK